MGKKVAFFDIDGVIYDGHTIFDIILDQQESGFITQDLYKSIMKDLASYKSGKKSYTQAANSMLKKSAQVFKGKKYSQILTYNYNFLRQQKHKFFDYFPKTLNVLKRTYDVYLVSTNFQFTVEAVAKIFNVDYFLSSIVEVSNGLVTGKVALSLAGNKGIVRKTVDNYGRTGSIAVGDSENDAPMLESVENALVFEPNEKMGQTAVTKGWTIVDRNNAHTHILDLI